MENMRKLEAPSNPKSSNYEVEESVTETISTDNLHKESLNLHTPPKPAKTTSTDIPNKESLLHKAPKPVNIESVKKTKKHNPLGNLSTSYEHDIEINLLKLKLDRFAENVSTKLDDLAFEINYIKENKPYSIVILEDQINELKKEKRELRRINDDHQKRIINMSCTISDLKSTNRNLEDEKSSLLTATV